MIKRTIFIIAEICILLFGITSFVFTETLTEKTAPDFILPDISGREIKLTDYFPQKAVVLWITNLCSGCQEGLPILQEFSKIYEEKIEFLAIVQPNINIPKARQIKNASKASFPFLMDYKAGASKLYGGADIVGICPLKNIFFIDNKGIVRDISHYPGLDEKDLEKYLELIL